MLAGAPEALRPAAQSSALTQAESRIPSRSQFVATYQSRLDAMVYSSGSAVRDDVSGPGTWAFIPRGCPTERPSRSADS